MTADELYAQIERNHDAVVEAELASRRTPIMTRNRGNPMQHVAEELGLAAYQRVKNNRAYAVATDPVARLELGALAKAARQSKHNVVKVITTVAETVEAVRRYAEENEKGARFKIGAWLRDLPAEDAGTIPELPIDKATGLRCRNPFLPLPPKDGETKPRFDHASQHVIKEQSPRLAKWLEDCAANDGLSSVAMLDQLEAERLLAKAKREIRYSDKLWSENKLRRDVGATVTEQNLFVKAIEDPSLIELHRLEAKLGVPRLEFGNHTVANFLAKRDAEVREIHRQAEQIFKQWQAEQQDKAA